MSARFLTARERAVLAALKVRLEDERRRDLKMANIHARSGYAGLAANRHRMVAEGEAQIAALGRLIDAEQVA